MNNIIILTNARSGSNFITEMIAANLQNVGEYLGCTGRDHINLHKQIIKKYSKDNYEAGLKTYARLLKALSEQDHNTISNVLDINNIKSLIDFYPHGICLKLFSDHFDGRHNTFNINDIIEIFDKIVILYRNNVLKQFISKKIAKSTGVWHLSKPDHKKSIPKILWNKDEYIDFYDYMAYCYNIYHKTTENINKPLAILCYEEVLKQKDKRLYIQNALDNAGFKHIVSDQTKFIKQSDNDVAYEDYFINQGEFLEDLEHISVFLQGQ